MDKTTKHKLYLYRMLKAVKKQLKIMPVFLLVFGCTSRAEDIEAWQARSWSNFHESQQAESLHRQQVQQQMEQDRRDIQRARDAATTRHSVFAPSAWDNED